MPTNCSVTQTFEETQETQYIKTPKIKNLIVTKTIA